MINPQTPNRKPPTPNPHPEPQFLKPLTGDESTVNISRGVFVSFLLPFLSQVYSALPCSGRSRRQRPCTRRKPIARRTRTMGSGPVAASGARRKPANSTIPFPSGADPFFFLSCSFDIFLLKRSSKLSFRSPLFRSGCSRSRV